MMIDAFRRPKPVSRRNAQPFIESNTILLRYFLRHIARSEISAAAFTGGAPRHIEEVYLRLLLGFAY